MDVRPNAPPSREAELIRLLVETTRDYAVFLVGLDGRVLTWNVGAERVLGYRAAEAVGSPVSLVFTPEDRAAGVPEEELRTAVRDGRADDDRWHMRKDGARIWVSGVMVRLADEAGQPQACAKVMRDLTEAKLAAEALRESEATLRVALAAAKMGTWTLDLGAHVHRRDGNLSRIFGLGEGEARVPFDEFLSHIHPDERESVREAFGRSARERRDLAVEFRVIRPDGTVRWLRDQGDVLDRPDGQPPLMAGACVDITERKHAEDELRRSHDLLEERVRQRTAELAGVLADLRAEMAARRELMGRLVTAQEAERLRIARDLHDGVGQYVAALAIGLRSAQEEACRGGDIRARLESLAGLAADTGRELHRAALELRPTSLDDLGLGLTLRNYAEAWSARTGIPAEFAEVGAEGVRLPWAVSTAAYRVAQEALTNALKYASATRVSLVLEHRPGTLVLVVEDDGRGFDPEATPAARPDGGLGLLGMRERAEMVGGTLQVESAPGAGTAVYLRVPVPPHPESGTGS